ncbi:unnamed protein product, partial [Allacma fusca]
ADAEDERNLKKLTEFQARKAKRSRRVKADGNSASGGDLAMGPNKHKKRSKFEDELTNTKKARKFRHNKLHHFFLHYTTATAENIGIRYISRQ